MGQGWGRGWAIYAVVTVALCLQLLATVESTAQNTRNIVTLSLTPPSLPPCCCRLRNIMENMIKLLVSLFEMAFLMSKVNLDFELEFG